METIIVEADLDYYRSFYENAPIGFFTANIKDGIFQMANPACMDILNVHTMEELQCVSIFGSLMDEYREDFAELILHERVAIEFETEIVLDNGVKKWVSISARMCKEDQCIEGSIIDITDRKALEEKVHEMAIRGIERMKKVSQNARTLAMAYAS